MKKKGLIHIYTGDGKGKTTAAVGLACRALGHGFKVCYISFHKDPKRCGYGEFKALKKLGASVFAFAKQHPHFFKGVDSNALRRECLEGLEFIKKIYKSKKHDILICDEINVAVHDGFLKEEEVIEILDSKPNELELILTGRYPSERMVKRAHLVSEIKKVKHPYDSGMKGRMGIEY
ncbi:MAG: cob(I)yrinic acid a,c-diamide adenosyltransferase [Candidatus Omnitrophica bacterium]|nr:cob(I)yrinic acid a,c-diamide adenosyltransferase [Candidatus Omnitrophota bacterium]